MEAYGDEREKGLFTFYLEQAELEDQLKNYKKELKRQKKNQDSAANVAVKNKEDAKEKQLKQKQSKNKEESEGIGKQEAKKKEQKAQDNAQHRHKLLQLLERQKYKNIKLHNLKIALKQGQPTNSQLKNHLSYIFGNQNGQQEILHKDKVFRDKSSGRHSPFQRLALCPTNFSTDFQEAPRSSRKPTQLLKARYGDDIQNQLRKSQKILANHSQQNKDKQIQNILKRHFLPRLQLKANPQKSTQLPQHPKYHKSQLHSYRTKLSQPDQSHSKVQPQRYVKVIAKDGPLMVQPFYSQQSRSRARRHQTKMYPIFSENSAGQAEEEVKADKEKMYLEMIRQLKFK